MEVEFNNVKPEQVLEAFKKMDMVPVTGWHATKRVFEGQTRNCGCGIGAIVAAIVNNFEVPYAGGSRLNSVLDSIGDSCYLYGFYDGFDGRLLSEGDYKNPESYQNGFKHGKASREALIAEGYQITS